MGSRPSSASMSILSTLSTLNELESRFTNLEVLGNLRNTLGKREGLSEKGSKEE